MKLNTFLFQRNHCLLIIQRTVVTSHSVTNYFPLWQASFVNIFTVTILQNLKEERQIKTEIKDSLRGNETQKNV